MNLDLRRSADFLRVLGHPIRIAVLASLIDGKKCVSDINDLLEISQPNLSQHLGVLRREGIIDYCENGKQRCYYVVRAPMIKSLLLLLSGIYPAGAIDNSDITSPVEQTPLVSDNESRDESI